MNPIAIVVVLMRPEMPRAVVWHEVTVARRDSMDVTVLPYPHEVASSLPHHILSAMCVTVVGSQTSSGGVSDPLGLLPSGVRRGTSC